jgi:hypothetical protein
MVEEPFSGHVEWLWKSSFLDPHFSDLNPPELTLSLKDFKCQPQLSIYLASA